MKKNTRESAKQSGKREKSQRVPIEQRVIFGTYHNINGQDTIVANGTEYPIHEISKNVTLPIEENSEVKGLVRPLRANRGTKVILLRVFGPKPSLTERIGSLLKDACVPLTFSKQALDESARFGESVSGDDRKRRTDFTKLALCTIDGESAKDFDDAVYAQKSGSAIEIFVAIADVSHYVKIGSRLDEEALSRGTSIYYPGHCVPMLPEALSNGLCSLKPDVLRLSVVVSFVLGPKGRIQKVKIREGVIKSAARLTYNQVQSFYEGKESKSSLISKRVQNSLLLLKDAAHILRKARERRGAIDFDLVESVIALDNLGEPIAIHPQDRLDSHKIIEDLMVVTNELVAEFFVKKDLPCLFRVHESPDQEKLENFFNTARAVGVLDKRVKSKQAAESPKELQKVMALYQKSKYKEMLNSLMLRSMMQARYSEKNLKHFGLASNAYLHFTSPIRRYADLVVHRQLRYFLFEKSRTKKIPESAMAEIAQSISQKEVRATDLERKIDRVYAATFMASHVGESFDAVIVSCTEFGFFVRIGQYHVEGLVHIATIADTHVNYVPEKMALVVSGSNQKYVVGDTVKVRLINVNIDRGHVDFELAQDRERSRSRKPRRRERAKNQKS